MMDTTLTNASQQLAYTMALTNDTDYENSDGSFAAYSGPSSLTATKLPPAKGKPISAKLQREDECLKRIMANTKPSNRIPWSVLAKQMPGKTAAHLRW
ncbi:hypothetical protein THAOC_05747, partial [Thalassiosira oceanica]